MKHLRVLIVLLFVTAIALPAFFDRIVTSQAQDPTAEAPQADKVSGTGIIVTATDDPKFGPRCGPGIDCEGSNPFDTSTFTFNAEDGVRPPGADQCPLACPDCPQPQDCPPDQARAEEAPADFSNATNGFVKQSVHDADRDTFGKPDEIKDGLGPVYNAQACRECHQNPVSGGISQITELRAGHTNPGNIFFDAPGGSLINDRAINSKVQERVPPLFSALVFTRNPDPTASPNASPSPIPAEEPVRTFRTSLNLLGDGFVEAIPNGTLLAISNAQAQATGGTVHGDVLAVPVLEANLQQNHDCKDPSLPCIRRIGRFGWKNQIPSLLSFSGDAYLNEQGITNFLVRQENSSLGRPVGAFDDVPDDTPCNEKVEFCPECPCGEDVERDIDAFTQFMRATKAPPQDADIKRLFEDDVKEGRALFTTMPGLTYSCSVCHIPAIVTARPQTVINGGTLPTDVHLGFKIIRPFSDFLLHDIGTGDGIVQNGPQTTRLKVRTPPLWGVRTRTRLMHDGSGMNAASLTFMEAILRHQGEAKAVTARFQLLTDEQKRQIIIFLESL
jgi:CxxC motif-containing protein (DUF1111 family)